MSVLTVLTSTNDSRSDRVILFCTVSPYNFCSSWGGTYLSVPPQTRSDAYSSVYEFASKFDWDKQKNSAWFWYSKSEKNTVYEVFALFLIRSDTLSTLHILISGSITPKGTRQGPLQQWLKCVTSIRHRGVAMTFWPLPTWVSHHQPLFHFTTTTSRRLPWQWPRHLPAFQVEVTFKTSFAMAEGLHSFPRFPRVFFCFWKFALVWFRS